jgi:16S rRNA (guanine966-N2)-methyltransferase
MMMLMLIMILISMVTIPCSITAFLITSSTPAARTTTRSLFLLSSSTVHDSDAAIRNDDDNTSTDEYPPHHRIQMTDDQNSLPINNNNNNNNNIPANLRRQVQAKRPTLGHVVPAVVRRKQRNDASSGGSIPSQLRYQGRSGSNGGYAEEDGKLSSHSKNNNYSLLRIMAGTARGKKLESPRTVYLRPMMGKVKEAVYSTLTAMGIYPQSPSPPQYSTTTRSVLLPTTDRTTTIPCRHLDVYAGSGSVGLESLSRGATHCTFIDMNRDCCRCIQRNLDHTGLGGSSNSNSNSNHHHHATSAIVCCTDAMTALRNPYSGAGIPMNQTYHIITVCPPYEEVVYGDLLEAIVGSDLVMEDTVVVIEYPTELYHDRSRSRQQQRGSSSTKTKTTTSTTANDVLYTTGGMPHVLHAQSNVAIGLRNRKYGRTVIAMYIINPTGRYPDAVSRPEEFI